MSFLTNLRALSLPQQIMLAAAVLGVFASMTFLARGALEQPMALLYSGLGPSQTGEIIEELEKRGANYELRGNAIFVAQKQRDTVRVSLARDGLPEQSVQGYELLDEVNGFSVTSEMYNAAYWRAKEGELTRTILAIPGITAVRVHIGASLRSGFARSAPKQTASVTLATSYDLSQSQAEAIQYLVALAVSGMSPDEVAVIDSKSGILAGPGINPTGQPVINAESQETMLEQKVLRLLEARVGPNNARVSVSLDVSHELLRTSAVVYDPDSRVVRTRSSGDINETSGAGAAGITAASNLPQTAGANGGQSSSATKNSSENVSYEISETRTESEMLPGSIQRISIAVLLNEETLSLDPGSAGSANLTEEVLADLQQLIGSAVGLDAERGDELTVEFMPFQSVAVPEMIAAPSFIEQSLDRYMWSGVKIFMLGIVTIALAFGVIRPLMRQDPNSEFDAGDAEAPATEDVADPFDSFRNYTSDREDDAADILRQWLNEDRKVAINE